MAECSSFATAIPQRALACEPPGARGGRRPSRGTPAPRGSGPRSCSRAAARAGPTRCACCGVCSTSVCCGATRACCARSRSRPRTSIRRTVSSSWTRAPTCRSGSAGASASSARASASNTRWRRVRSQSSFRRWRSRGATSATARSARAVPLNRRAVARAIVRVREDRRGSRRPHPGRGPLLRRRRSSCASRSPVAENDAAAGGGPRSTAERDQSIVRSQLLILGANP